MPKWRELSRPYSLQLVESDAADVELVEERSFLNVIQNLRTAYPTEKMAEISTSFCFICLLHLANEEGLKIETASGDKAAEEERIGALEQLKVWKVSSTWTICHGRQTDILINRILMLDKRLDRSINECQLDRLLVHYCSSGCTGRFIIRTNMLSIKHDTQS